MASPSFTEIQLDLSNFNFQYERMDVHTAAAYLGISPQFLRSNVVTKRHAIPRIKVGNRVFYLKSDLDAYLMSQRVEGSAA